MNNLNDLNKVLFETIEGLKDGSIEVSKAQAIKGLGDTVINGAKTLLQAHKQANATSAPAFFELPEAPAPQPIIKEKKKLELNGKSPGEILAHQKGYDSVAVCRAKMGEKAYTEALKIVKEQMKDPEFLLSI
jgi:hypothetical protein